MLPRPPRLPRPPPDHPLDVPPPGTVTGVANGAAVIVPIDWLRELNTLGMKPGELTALLDQIDAARSEHGDGVAS
jgi:hypothetical protein